MFFGLVKVDFVSLVAYHPNAGQGVNFVRVNVSGATWMPVIMDAYAEATVLMGAGSTLVLVSCSHCHHGPRRILAPRPSDRAAAADGAARHRLCLPAGAARRRLRHEHHRGAAIGI